MLPYYRKNLYVLWVANFAAAASWTLILPFLPLFLVELGVDDHISQWSGLIFSIHFAAAIIMMPFWGKLADRVGRKPMTIRAGLCLAVIYFLTGMSTEAWHVVVLRFLNGALTGFIPMSIALMATNTPRAISGRYVALLQTAAASGSIIGPVIGGTLASVFGVRGAFSVAGTAVLISTLLVLFLVQERNKPERNKARSTMLADVRTALVTPILWVSMFLSLMASIGIIGVQPVLALHMGTLLHDPEPWMTGLIFSLPGIAFVGTATAWVRQLQRHGFRKVTLVALLGTGLFSVLAGLVGNVLLFAALFFMMSLFLGALRPVSSALISTDVDPAFHGRAFGMHQSAFTVGGLLGPLAAGAVAGFFGNPMVFVAVGLAFLLSPFVMVRHLAHAKGEASDGVAVRQKAHKGGSNDGVRSTR